MQYYTDPDKAMQQQSTRDDINKKTADIDAKKKDSKPTSKPSTTPKTICARPAAIPAGPAKPTQMEPLLLVEDKAELRAMLRKALERAGYAVDEAPDGTAAIDKVAQRAAICWFLSDLKLPGASGTRRAARSEAAPIPPFPSSSSPRLARSKKPSRP